MKRNLLILFLLLILSPLAYGQNHWDVDNNYWSTTMSVIAVVNVDGEELRTSDIEIAAFNGEELRSDGVKLKYEETFDRYIAYLYARGEEPYTMTFKLYDHGIGEELDYACMTSVQYAIDGTLGEVNSPYVINFKVPVTFTGSGSWNDVSNWNNSTLPTETDGVVIDGNAFISGNVTINSLVINEGKSLTIQDGGILTVIGEISNTDYDALIIEDGGQIIQTNENVAATFKKNIVNPSSWSNPVSGWQFISSPVLDAATADFASTEGDYDLYKFDGIQELQWVNYKNHDDFEETFESGIGYIASYETQEIATFKGMLNNEIEYFDFGIGYNSNNEWANFYLLGNPFSFDINWDLMDAYRTEEGFATIDANTGAYTYNVEGSIKVGEGFMICASRKNAALEYIASAKSRKAKSDYINIIASNSKGSDNVILRFGETESSGFPKLENINPNIAKVYVKEDDKCYGIYNSNPEVKEISLYFDAKEMGSYTLTFDVKGNYENLYLIDKMTGEEVNLLLENEYRFTAISNDSAERFVLKLNSDTDSDNSHFAYINNGDIVIYDIEGDAEIRIVDALGRCLYNGECSDEIHRVDATSHVPTNGVYMIQKIDDSGIKVQKLMVNSL